MPCIEKALSRRVFVTGRGVSLGKEADIAHIWSQVATDNMMVSTPDNLEDLSVSAGLSLGDSGVLGRHQLLALSAVESAWQEAELPSLRNPIRGQTVKVRNGQFGCFGGSALGGLVAFEGESASRPSPYSLTRWRGNAIVSVVSVRYGLGGMSLSINAASASGAQSIVTAGHLIRSGLIEGAVVVLADSTPSPKIHSAMKRNGSVSQSQRDRPLSGERTGMTPAEGAAAIILESDQALESRGGLPICEWIDGSSESEAFHLLAPDPSGSVLKHLLGSAKQHLSGVRLHWLSLHATGTRIFDAIEMRIIQEVFAPETPWISAMKRTTGHTLGAAGVLEAVLISEGLRVGEWPAFPIDIDPLLWGGQLKTAPPTPPDGCIQIGQGMGGVVAVNVWERVVGR
jgi:3-oxoacyl-[acyl-carrier-protein] synthase II